MEKNYFIALLRKSLKNETTKQEEEVLNKYYNLYRDEPDVLELLGEEQKLKFRNELQRDIWESINKNEQAPKVLHMKRRSFQLVAAAAAALILVSTIVLFIDKDSSQINPVLTVGNQLKENHVIRLADGSTVVLGYQSKIQYPPGFDGLSTREVYLEGEAFFDIAEDSLKPFIVHSGNVQTKVLGTAFNIKAYPNEKDITVTVKRGKVRVETDDETLGIIIPEQQIVYNKKGRSSIQKTVNPDAYLVINHDDLFFDNLSFAEAARLLEDRFNVEIVIVDDAIRNKKFTATVPFGQKLDATLQSLCEFNSAEYVYDEQESTITIKAKN